MITIWWEVDLTQSVICIINWIARSSSKVTSSRRKQNLGIQNITLRLCQHQFVILLIPFLRAGMISKECKGTNKV